jgi:hypothetical protein
MAIGRLASITIDCDDPPVLARFWLALVGGEVALTRDGLVALRTTSGWLAVVRVPDYRPPTWPDAEVPTQMHIDIAVDDLDTAETEAIKLGARRAALQPTPDRYRVLIDPAGHPFCLSIQIPD